MIADISFRPGGKAKPLKAAKKVAKELDEDDKAFLEKKRAGTKANPLDPMRSAVAGTTEC